MLANKPQFARTLSQLPFWPAKGSPSKIEISDVSTYRLRALTCWLVGFILIGTTGCSKPTPPIAVATRSSNAPPKRVNAQGQIMPAKGIVKIYITPGDVVSELSATVGAKVKKGELLAVMRSVATLKSQTTSLVEQKLAALRERDTAVKQAELKLSAAEMKLQQVQSQQQSLDRQSGLISSSEEQIVSSERILQQLRNIASDSLTREFVGQIEIDRQRLSIEEARIKVSQQKNSRDQAALDLQLAAQAAVAEVEAARTLLEMARSADPAKAFDAQINAVEAETGRSNIVAPIDGVILAVHTSVGGSVVQTPLIELADVDSVVCELEVNVTQARWVKVGQKVTITSDSLPEALSGQVQDVSQVVGKPRLRSLDPLAAVDYRTLPVIVSLENSAIASQWLQLQVEGQIDLSTASP
jgi:ABC exporter DevB family membrane fusion protein